MKKQPKLYKPSQLFNRKVILTIHPWGVVTICAATGVGTAFGLTRLASVIALIVVAVAVVGVWRMSRMVRELQYTIHNIKYNIENETLDDEEDYQEFINDRIDLKRANGSRNARVSK